MQDGLFCAREKIESIDLKLRQKRDNRYKIKGIASFKR
jgi:hypothetical protein